MGLLKHTHCPNGLLRSGGASLSSSDDRPPQPPEDEFRSEQRDTALPPPSIIEGYFAVSQELGEAVVADYRAMAAEDAADRQHRRRMDVQLARSALASTFAFMVLVGVLGRYIVDVVDKLASGWEILFVTMAPSSLVAIALWAVSLRVGRRADEAVRRLRQTRGARGDT